MSVVKDNIATQPISLTDGAVKQLKRINQEQNVPEDHGLRVGVKGGGCSGFSYILGFDVKKENDDVYQINGLTVFMEKAHAIYLLGIEIDLALHSTTLMLKILVVVVHHFLPK